MWELMKKMENALLIVGFFVMFTLLALFFLPTVEFQDSNYKLVNSFVESGPMEKKIDTCIYELGQPVYMDENVACFPGGFTRRIGYVCESKEYDFIVEYDEERRITDVHHVCKLSLRKGASSLLELIF